MKVLIGCEESGIVTAAFRARGHEAWSCDLEETRGNPNWHIKGDAPPRPIANVSRNRRRKSLAVGLIQKEKQMPIIKWSGLLSGSHKIRQIKEFEATSKREIIPPETPILYYETVSWWRSPFRKPPLQTEWRYLNHTRVAYWYFPADSDAFRAFNKFVQGLF